MPFSFLIFAFWPNLRLFLVCIASSSSSSSSSDDEKERKKKKKKKHKVKKQKKCKEVAEETKDENKEKQVNKKSDYVPSVRPEEIPDIPPPKFLFRGSPKLKSDQPPGEKEK